MRKTIIFVTHDIDEAIKLGDRIAILREGGVLAQYDTPDAILAHPADEFVARFVGADRGLKRLRCGGSASVELEPPNGVAGRVARRAATTLRDALSLDAHGRRGAARGRRRRRRRRAASSRSRLASSSGAAG